MSQLNPNLSQLNPNFSFFVKSKDRLAQENDNFYPKQGNQERAFTSPRQPPSETTGRMDDMTRYSLFKSVTTYPRPYHNFPRQVCLMATLSIDRGGTLSQVHFLLIYICNFHVLNHLLLIYICKLHWNLNTMFVCKVIFF